jgi:hypothetical protein
MDYKFCLTKVEVNKWSSPSKKPTLVSALKQTDAVQHPNSHIFAWKHTTYPADEYIDDISLKEDRHQPQPGQRI